MADVKHTQGPLVYVGAGRGGVDLRELLEAIKEYHRCAQHRLNSQHAFDHAETASGRRAAARALSARIDAYERAEQELCAIIAKAEGRS